MSDISRHYDKYEDKTAPLTKNDIPALMALLMDQFDIDRFEFTIQELMDKGEAAMELTDWGNGRFVLTKMKS